MKKSKSFLFIFIILISTIINAGCFKENNSDFDNYFNQVSQNAKSFFNNSKNKNNKQQEEQNKNKEIKKDKQDENNKLPEIDKKYCAVCGLELNGDFKISDGQNLCENCWNNKTLAFKPYNSNDTAEKSEATNNNDEEDNEDDSSENDTEDEPNIPSPVYSDPTLCCLCGNQLEKYWTYKDLKYCPDCYDKYVVQKCARCNNPLSQYYKVKKKRYCKDCYENYIAERCYHCNNRLIGQYFKYNNKKYCPDCYDNHIVERCYYCNKKLDQYYKGNNGKVCKECFMSYEVPKCLVCHNPIMAKYYIFPTGKCCEDCFQKNPHCFNCGLPTEYPAYRDDDFVLCSSCNKDKITTRDDVNKLYDKVKLYVKKSCGISVDLPSEKIILSSSAELKERTKNVGYLSGQRVLGYCYTTYALSNLYNHRAHTIYIQNGMPYELAFKTLSHEYGHAWDHQNTDLEIMKQSKDHAFSEGFAEWVSYNTMKEYGIKDKVEQMTNTPEKDLDPIYGVGFQKMLKLEENLRSKHALLEYVKNNNNFKD